MNPGAGLGFNPFGGNANPSNMGGLDFSTLLGNSASNPSPAPSSAPQEPPEVRYASQLQQLQDMGFPNTPANITALTQSNGCVTQAVERLLGQR
jgi:ubiquilin